MAELDPTLDAALDPEDPTRRRMLPLTPPRPAIPPLMIPQRPATLGPPSLAAPTSAPPPVNIAPPLVSRPTAPPAPTGALSATPTLSTTPKVGAPIPAGAITMPDPNNPAYRPLGGWRAALANLSQLSPEQGIRDIGLRALGAPAERLKVATEGVKSNLDLEKEQAEIAKLKEPPAGKEGSLSQQESDTVDELVAGGMPRLEALAQVKQAGGKPEKPEEPKFEKDEQGNIIQLKTDPKTGETTASVLYHGQPKVETDITQATIGGQEHHVLVNKATGDVIKDLGAFKAEKPEKAPGEDAFARGLSESAVKDVATARSADFRYRTMVDSLPKAKAGDQQAMLNLLTNHIGMTLGLQKGARITKDILNEATQSAPWLARIKSKFDNQGYLSGVTLTPEQMDSMMGLAVQQRGIAWQQARESGEQAGVEKQIQFPKDLAPAAGTTAAPSGKTVSLKAAMGLPANKGKSEADVRKDIEAHGHTVGE